ncbi:uncharacterized protein MKK02DRAFT_37755 [Dioszegia hungarica]|uniref:WKF domain-containing protein n=1 Tax=Dioszegia hungarica TaxID=4972 RepID=A0AA38H6K5_9TREE|nr:uncharacterized protein MKK02DRAFT_37755 [Dioszegia hungarica]KAI9634880.1 hypothetical protein MKK02DRAFT_37755 [Dioszegia hungarica]
MPAEASTSKTGGVKAPKMIDGREETKEERKARKAAKRAEKGVASAEASGQSTGMVPAAGPSSEVAQHAADGAAGSEKKSKKDKKRKRAEEVPAPTGDVSPEEGAASEKAGTVEAVVDPQEEKRARKAARKAEKAASRAAAVGGPPPPEVIAAETEPAGPSEPVLSEPARKALQYVQSYAATHLSEGPTPAEGQRWKFNKANQNWLIRNVWNESEVPEEHVDAVMRYLNTIKGGGRKALIEMAEKCSAASTADAPEPAPAVAPEAAATSTDPKTAVPTPAVPAAVVAAATPVVSPEEAKRDREVIKARAEKLLVLLRAE